ncbi:hypothetical protein [Promicromonospora sp. NPDC050249]|uniref:hypothetical protein n=1 Tax=Promicromonospora sp. NPDC050249 TaxID=3154743 RepID=UPI0033E7CA1B
MGDDSLYQWATCGRESFDRVVELLLQRRHQAEPGEVQAVDGRGGDEGIDVDVTSHDGTIDTIYQLKYFPEGFSGGFRETRRRQITKSFNAAMKHKPRRWVLVFPGRPTPKERSYVHKLAGGRRVEIAILGRDKLDLLMAENPDIHRHVTTGPLTEALRLSGNEHLALATPIDLDRAAVSLGERIDARSAFWGVNVTIGADGSIQQEFVPKRPDAFSNEPLSLKPEFRSGPAGDLAKTQLDELHAYGGPGITINADALASIELVGPDWFARNLKEVSVVFGPIAISKEVPIEVRLIAPSGATLQSLEGHSRMSRGRVGGRLEVMLDCGIEFDFKMPRNGERVTASVATNHEGRRIHEVAASISFMDRLESDTDVMLEIWAGDKRLFTFGRPDSPLVELSPDAYTRQLVDDLHVLSRHFSVPLRLPEELTWAQREEIRKCRLVVDGKVVEERNFRELTVTLNGTTSESLEGTIQREAMMVVVETDVHFIVQGQRLPVRAQVFHPRAHVIEPQAVAAALRDQTAAGMRVRIGGVDDTAFRIVLANDARRDPNEPLAVEPLGIVEPEATSHS